MDSEEPAFTPAGDVGPPPSTQSAFPFPFVTRINGMDKMLSRNRLLTTVHVIHGLEPFTLPRGSVAPGGGVRNREVNTPSVAIQDSLDALLRSSLGGCQILMIIDRLLGEVMTMMTNV